MISADINIKRFYPINKWEVDAQGPRWKVQERGFAFIKDLSTEDRYLNEDKNHIRRKFVFCFFGSLMVQPIALLVNLIVRIIRLVSFHAFWRKPKHTYTEGTEFLTLRIRTAECVKNILRVIATPVVLPLFALSSLYGLIRPYDGRKLYGNLEAAIYGRSLIAPCFQPNPKKHLFGSDILDHDGW